MKLGIVTYRAPHLKTEQLVNNLILRGGFDISLFALPFMSRKPREIIFHHRPDMSANTVHPSALASLPDVTYVEIDGAKDIPLDRDIYLVGGAGILPSEFVTQARVVNSHPGLLPAVRGLDAFKWAIYDAMPLGNTLHLIDAEVDCGAVLKTLKTPVYKGDTLGSLARRHYEMEISLFSRFDQWLDREGAQTAGPSERPARMRMPLEIEKEMIARVPEYIEKFSNSDSPADKG